MSERDEQWLRDSLDATNPPEGLTPIERLGAVHEVARRSRRRRTTVAVGLSVVALVACAGVGLAITRDRAGRTSGPVTHTADSTKPFVDLTPVCQQAGMVGDLTELPTGPVSVVGCLTPFDEPEHEQAQEPMVSIDLGQLVDVVNAGDVKPFAGGCLLDGGPTFTLAFSYPDGSVVNVGGALAGCRTTSIGDGPHLNAGDNPSAVWNAFRRLLLEQRKVTDPPGATRPLPDCDGSGDPLFLASSGLSLSRARTARICVFDRSRLVASLDLDSARLEALITDFEGNQTVGMGSDHCGSGSLSLVLYGMSDWNDVIVMYGRTRPGDPGCLSFSSPDARGGQRWVPGEAVQALIAGLIG